MITCRPAPGYKLQDAIQTIRPRLGLEKVQNGIGTYEVKTLWILVIASAWLC
jgi:hypothetical protein